MTAACSPTAVASAAAAFFYGIVWGIAHYNMNHAYDPESKGCGFGEGWFKYGLAGQAYLAAFALHVVDILLQGAQYYGIAHLPNTVHFAHRDD